MNTYKIEWSYLDSSNKRLYKSDLFFVPKVADAIKKIQAEYSEYKELRVEDVWQDSGYSWDSVDHCLWEQKVYIKGFNAMDRTNYRLNTVIERFIDNYDGTAIGQDIRNMYENGCDYESICDRMGVDYEEYKED